MKLLAFIIPIFLFCQISIGQEGYSEYLRKAYDLCQDGEFIEAQSNIEQAMLTDDSTKIKAWYVYGLVYRGLSDSIPTWKEKDSLIEASISCYDRALTLSTSSDDHASTMKYIRNSIIKYYNIGALALKDSNYHVASSSIGKYIDYGIKYELDIVTLEQLAQIQSAMSDMAQAVFDKDEQLRLALDEQHTAYKTQKEAEIESDKQLRLLLIIIVGIITISLILLFNRFRITKRQKSTIESQKADVEAHRQEILDSINYAKRIQSAILPPTKLVKEHLEDSFILYKPKDIVAGDFYWLEPFTTSTNSQGVLFAAADCTGHGVPGAMVSVVCNHGLNQAVRQHGITDPGLILDKTRDLVISEFEKSEEEVKDGMDIAICALHKSVESSKLKDESWKLEYAGANNPLWIISNRKIHNCSHFQLSTEGGLSSLVLNEVKPNKQPIGKFDQPLPYTTHEVQLNKGDTIYIFSDGYVDQFGGDKGKKFKAKNFKSLLLSIQAEPMEKQGELIDEAFETWKGDLEQLDDVCLIGVRV